MDEKLYIPLDNVQIGSTIFGQSDITQSLQWNKTDWTISALDFYKLLNTANLTNPLLFNNLTSIPNVYPNGITGFLYQKPDGNLYWKSQQTGEVNVSTGSSSNNTSSNFIDISSSPFVVSSLDKPQSNLPYAQIIDSSQNALAIINNTTPLTIFKQLTDYSTVTLNFNQVSFSTLPNDIIYDTNTKLILRNAGSNNGIYNIDYASGTNLTLTDSNGLSPLFSTPTGEACIVYCNTIIGSNSSLLNLNLPANESAINISNTSNVNSSPMIKLSNDVGTGPDIQFSARTTDPTTTNDGSFWYDSTNSVFKYKTAAATKVLYPIDNIDFLTNPTFNNLAVTGNLYVTGTTTTVNTTNLIVADTFIKIADGNISPTTDIGFYSTYRTDINDALTTKYMGLYRDGTSASWYLFDGVSGIDPGSAQGFNPSPSDPTQRGILYVNTLNTENLTCTNTITGNAATATLASSADKLSTARNIAGTSFDGTTNITLSTSGITEGSNLYFTNSRAQSALSGLYEPPLTAGTTSQYYRGDKSWQTLTTSAVTEGTNLYYTNARVYSAMFGLYEAPLAFGTTSQYYRGDKSWQTLNTSVVTEGTNLYFTNARALSALSGLYEPPLAAGTSLQYYRGDKAWAILNTTAVSEGTNLYYTDARVRSLVSSGFFTNGLKYDSGTGTVMLDNSYAPTFTGLTCQTGYLATTAVSGFLNIPCCAGTPTGSVGQPYANIPLVYDNVNNKLYAYNNAWNQVGGSSVTLPEPATNLIITDDFISIYPNSDPADGATFVSDVPWQVYRNNGGFCLPVSVSDSTVSGTMCLQSNNATGFGYISIYSQRQIKIPAGSSFVLEMKCAMTSYIQNTLTTSTYAGHCCGLYASKGQQISDGTNHVFAYIGPSNNISFQIATNTVNTGVVASINTYYKLRLECNCSTNTINYYINGTKYGPYTYTIPTGMMYLGIHLSDSQVQRSYTDYIYFNLTASR